MKIEKFIIVKHFGFFEKESKIELAANTANMSKFDSLESAASWLREQADCSVEQIENFSDIFEKPQLVVPGSRWKGKDTIKVFVEKEHLIIDANYHNWRPFGKTEGYFIDVTCSMFSILKECTEVHYYKA